MSRNYSIITDVNVKLRKNPHKYGIEVPSYVNHDYDLYKKTFGAFFILNCEGNEKCKGGI